MSSERLYSDRADLYDAVYHWKSYAAEAEKLHALLAAEGVPDGARLLEAACGTGQYLVELARWYRVSGFDLHEGSIDVARAKLPAVRTWRADMCDFTVDDPVDVLACLFSSIGYLTTRERLSAAARRFAAAVRPGGVLVVEPWFGPDHWDAGRPTVQTYSSPDLGIARATIAQREDDMAVMDMHYLVARRGAPEVERFQERHVMWLCPRETLLGAFADAGFDVRFDETGLMPDRGLVVGHRR